MHRSHKDKGFTLVELLILIVIIGVLIVVTVFAVQGIQKDNEKGLPEPGITETFASVKMTTASVPFEGIYVVLAGSDEKIYSGDQYLLSCPVETIDAPLNVLDTFTGQLAEHGMMIVMWHSSDGGYTNDGFAVNAAGSPEQLQSNIDFVDSALQQLGVSCLQGK